MTWDEGEVSMDMSMWRTSISVTGTKVHYESTYSGRMKGMPGNAPLKTDMVLKDPKKLAAALAALDKIPVGKPAKRSSHPYSGQESSGCLTRGNVTRCTRHRGAEPETDEYKAVVAVKALLEPDLVLVP
ncbi:MAG: hypothetical protein ABI467_17415 [Kofleriaceae bacterium]